jgi:F-type H+-transporting ATPase subunit delta
MARGAAARRYAKALYALAREEGRPDDVRAELGRLKALLEANAELHDVLMQPIHPAAERRAVLARVSERLGSSPLLERFYGFLIRQRRLVDFDAIVREYERLADAEAGVTQAQVRSASPLRDEQLERVRRALAARTGRQVTLHVEVDPALIGGVVAQVGDLVFDGSLRAQLEHLRANLVRE